MLTDSRGSATVFSVAAMGPISLIALATASATDSPPRATVVVAARATIVSGVRIAQDGQRSATDAEPLRLPRPRERPCPEPAQAQCRLIVTDLP